MDRIHRMDIDINGDDHADIKQEVNMMQNEQNAAQKNDEGPNTPLNHIKQEPKHDVDYNDDETCSEDESDLSSEDMELVVEAAADTAAQDTKKKEETEVPPLPPPPTTDNLLQPSSAYIPPQQSSHSVLFQSSNLWMQNPASNRNNNRHQLQHILDHRSDQNHSANGNAPSMQPVRANGSGGNSNEKKKSRKNRKCKGGIYKCKVTGCTFSCDRKSGLKSHGDVHTNARPFRCPICKNHYKRKRTVKHHIETVHKKKKKKK